MNAIQEDLSKILGDAVGKTSKMSKKKKIIIVAIALVLIIAIVTGVIFGIKNKKEKETEPVLREYRAERGDIIVGLTESSVITLSKETVTFPVGAEVLEVYIKSGSEVKEGDSLAKLSTDDIAEAIKEYEAEITSAKLSLESTQSSKTKELLSAEQEMKSDILNGNLADEEYTVAVTQAKSDLKDAETKITDAQEKYDELTLQNKTFASDLATLTSYEDKVEECETNQEYYADLSDEVNKLSSELSKTESEIKSIADVSNMTQANAVLSELKDDYDDKYDRYFNSDDSEQQTVKYSEVLKAKEKYQTMKNSMNELDDLFDEKSKLEKNLKKYDQDAISNSLSDAEDALTEAKEAYNEFKEEFTEKYGNIADSEDMKDALEEAKNDLEKAKLSLTKQENSYETSLLSAEQKRQTAKTNASNAQKEYNLKSLELSQKVTDAQEQYTELQEQLEEIKEAVGNDGIIKATCDGVISSLNIEVGDEISVSSGSGMGESASFSSSNVATLMTITNMSEVNVSVSISEDDILDISLGQEAVVTLASYPDETFDATVNSISVEGATIGAASVSYTVNISFTDDGTHELYDGMSADVTLIQGAARDVIYVNEQAVSIKDGKTTVVLKDKDSDGVETEVKTGFSDGQYIEIVSGLNEGDTVLVESAVGGSSESKGETPDIDMGNMPDMGEMPDMGNFNPGDFAR